MLSIIWTDDVPQYLYNSKENIEAVI
jgi:hypothetical protein